MLIALLAACAFALYLMVLLHPRHDMSYLHRPQVDVLPPISSPIDTRWPEARHEPDAVDLAPADDHRDVVVDRHRDGRRAVYHRNDHLRHIRRHAPPQAPASVEDKPVEFPAWMKLAPFH
jgi:hypothetical protein